MNHNKFNLIIIHQSQEAQLKAIHGNDTFVYVGKHKFFFRVPMMKVIYFCYCLYFELFLFMNSSLNFGIIHGFVGIHLSYYSLY